MDKVEGETTRDFMNVDSFSQLPFIRPPPHKEKPIRLFGQEFGGDSGGAAHPNDSESSSSVTADTNPVVHNENNDENGGIMCRRRFECQYCCRNFPTSQALGGHQNAHKRERQHAKRAHFHSAAMIIGGGGGALPPEARVYRLHSAPATPFFPANTRLYGGHITGHSSAASPYSQTPINGNPLALWRLPTVQHNSSSYNHRLMHPPPSSMVMMSSANARQIGPYGFEPKPSVKDHNVSLDLHL